MKTIEQINKEIAKLNREAENYSIIAKYCGTKIAKELKKIPFFDSGYAMGGYFMFVTPNDEGFGKDNNCKEYARSCKYSATHGNVKAKFKTKKAMKDLFRKVAELQKNIYIGFLSKDKYKADTNYKFDNLVTYEELMRDCSELSKLITIDGLKYKTDVKHLIFNGLFFTLR